MPTVGRPEAVVECRYRRLRRLVIGADSNLSLVSRGRCRLSVPTVGRPEAVVECRYGRLVIGADSNCCQSRPLSPAVCRYRRLIIGADSCPSTVEAVVRLAVVDCRTVPTIGHIGVDSCQTFVGINDMK